MKSIRCIAFSRLKTKEKDLVDPTVTIKTVIVEEDFTKKNIDNYRIKPEVKYRPFKNLKECLEEMQCHIPYGWIKTDNNVHRLITLLDEDRTLIGNQETSWTYEKIFECFIFMDGKPFGVRY